METGGSYGRVWRGGYSNVESSPCSGRSYQATNLFKEDGRYCSRLTLWIK